MERILFLDPEEASLAELEKTLGTERGLWDMVFTGKGREALELFEKGPPFDVLVMALSLSDMDGIEFLSEVKERYADTVRICLTGPKDGDAMLRASTIAHQFMSQPCNISNLRILTLRASAIRAHLRDCPLRRG